MHDIPKPFRGITLHHRDGRIRRFHDINALVTSLGAYQLQEIIGPHFRVYSHQEAVIDGEGRVVAFKPQYREYDCIARDADVGVLDASGLLKIYRDLRRQQARPSSRAWGRYRFWNGMGPVPWTGRWRCSRYFRAPQTISSRRQSQVIDPDEPPVRIKRGMRAIPSNWDDIPRSDRGNDNWKRFRRQQWR